MEAIWNWTLPRTPKRLTKFFFFDSSGIEFIHGISKKKLIDFSKLRGIFYKRVHYA